MRRGTAEEWNWQAVDSEAEKANQKGKVSIRTKTIPGIC